MEKAAARKIRSMGVFRFNWIMVWLAGWLAANSFRRREVVARGWLAAVVLLLSSYCQEVFIFIFCWRKMVWTG